MKNALICTAVVLGLVIVGSADVNAGVYGNARSYNYSNFTPSHSNSYYNGRYRSNYSFGNTHPGNGYYNSGYAHQNRQYRPTHGYAGTSLQFNGVRIDINRNSRYGH